MVMTIFDYITIIMNIIIIKNIEQVNEEGGGVCLNRWF